MVTMKFHGTFSQQHLTELSRRIFLVTLTTAFLCGSQLLVSHLFLNIWYISYVDIWGSSECSQTHGLGCSTSLSLTPIYRHNLYTIC